MEDDKTLGILVKTTTCMPYDRGAIHRLSRLFPEMRVSGLTNMNKNYHNANNMYS